VSHNNSATNTVGRHSASPQLLFTYAEHEVSYRPCAVM